MSRNDAVFVVVVLLLVSLGLYLLGGLVNSCEARVQFGELYLSAIRDDPVGTVYHFRCEGNSMYPTLPASGKMCICVRRDEYNVGSVVIYVPTFSTCLRFERPCSFVTHRIVSEHDGLALLKGDNNPVADGWVSVDRIVCEVVGYIDRNGDVLWLR